MQLSDYLKQYNNKEISLRQLIYIVKNNEDVNKEVYKMLSDGFIFTREDRTQKDIFINLIDFDTPENNIFSFFFLL